MGQVLELVSGFVTAPGTTFTALTMAAGNSATVRNARADSVVQLLSAWADVQGAGEFRTRSPKLHDGVQGIRLDTVVSEVKPLLPDQFMQMLFPQDALTLELTGSATAGDIESAAMLIHYDDLPGAEGQFIDVETLMARMIHVLAVENTLALGTGGGYSGEEAINAEFDNFKANTLYALLGYLVSAECAAVRWRGADTGNFGVGGPGDELGRDYTRSWFVDLARKFGKKLIPVFNAANKDGILIDGVQDENGTDVTVTSLFGELSPGAVL
jgi:hypothetical protein